MHGKYLHLSRKHVPANPDFSVTVGYEIPGRGYVIFWADRDLDDWTFPIMEYVWNNDLSFVLFSDKGEVDPQFEVFT